MRSVRTSIFVATAAVALSWSGLGRAEDDVNNKTGTSPSSPAPTTDTSSGTGTDSADGTSYGSTQPYQPSQPYQTQTQSQPAQQESQQTTTYSTTTTTSGNVDPNASPPSSGADRPGWIYRPNRPMLFTGLGILTATYGASVIVGASSDKDVDKRLYIPVVGPWLDLGQRDCGLGDCGQTEDWNQALLIGSGVLQGVGTVLTVASLFAREETDRPANWRSASAQPAKPAKPTIQITPMSMRAGGGVGAVGTF